MKLTTLRLTSRITGTTLNPLKHSVTHSELKINILNGLTYKDTTMTTVSTIRVQQQNAFSLY